MNRPVAQKIERLVSERVFFEFRDNDQNLVNGDATPTVTFKDAVGSSIVDNATTTLSNVNLSQLTATSVGQYFYVLTLNSTQSLDFIYAFPKATINSAVTKLDEPIVLEVIEKEAVPSNQLLTNLFFVKDYLNIQNSDHDILLKSLINRMSRSVETFCNRKFKERTFTEQHDGDGIDGVVYCDNPPLTALQTLADDPDRLFPSSTNFITADRVIYEDEGRIELVHGASSTLLPTDKPVFTNSKQNIKIIYTGGFATVPSDIQMATTLWVAHEFIFVFNKRMGVTNRSVGDKDENFVERTKTMPSDVESILRDYRLIPMGNR